MKHHIVLLRLQGEARKWHSTNGNPRWRFHAQTASGNTYQFTTTQDASSAYACDLGRFEWDEVIRARMHITGTGKMMIDQWEDTRSSGVDLESEFEALASQHRAELRAEVEASERFFWAEFHAPHKSRE